MEGESQKKRANEPTRMKNYGNGKISKKYHSQFSWKKSHQQIQDLEKGEARIRVLERVKPANVITESF